MKNLKNKIVFTALSFSAIAGYFIFTNYSHDFHSTELVKIERKIKTQKVSSKVAHSPTNTKKKKSRPSVFHFPDIKERDAKDFKWGRNAAEKLASSMEKNVAIEVFYIGDTQFKNMGRKIIVKKAKFFLTNNESGKKSNFYALVDPVSGYLYRTWGATRYENYVPNDDFKLSVNQ